MSNAVEIAKSAALATDLGAVIQRYAGHGPLAAAFLANMLATFGDKGQLVVVTLASRYDAKRVFLGAMGAFTLWSALEVLLGQWITAVLPAGVIGLITGGLFLLFGVWTYRGVLRRLRSGTGTAETDGGTATSGVVSNRVLSAVSARGGLVTSFVFVLFAEFGDKTQLLTINLAATFPEAPLAVFVGVVAALGLRTGVDAVIGSQFTRWIPVLWIETTAAGVFLAFGLRVLAGQPGFEWLPPIPLWGFLVVPGLALLATYALRERWSLVPNR